MDSFERAFWPAFGVLALLVTVVVVIDACRRLRVRTPRCSRCGYDLSGQGVGDTRVCPECGCDLTAWGVAVLNRHQRTKSTFDAHAAARLIRWSLTTPALLALAFLVFAFPPFAMINRELTIYTIGPTPIAGTTIDVERLHTWVQTDWPTGERFDRSHVGETLGRSIVARDSSAGAPTIDLSGEGVRFADVLGWVEGLYPGVSPADADALAFAVFAQTEGYWMISAEEQDALGERAFRATVRAGVQSRMYMRNGVTNPMSSAHGVWPLIRSEIGSPTLAHAGVKHWLRLVLYVSGLVLVVMMHTTSPRLYRKRTRAKYRAWIALLEEGW